MIDYIKRLLARFGFGKRLPQMTVEEAQHIQNQMRSRALHAITGQLADLKNLRLQQIAAERTVLIARRAKLKRQKKAYVWTEDRLKALTNEELRLELGQ